MIGIVIGTVIAPSSADGIDPVCGGVAMIEMGSILPEKNKPIRVIVISYQHACMGLIGRE